MSVPPTANDSENDAVALDKLPQVPALTIRLWPKIPVLYPLAIVALICGILTSYWNDTAQHAQMHQVCGLIFLTVFFFCFFTITFDIGLTWALLWVFGVIIIGLVLTIINIFHPFLPDFFGWLSHLNPLANSHFYFSIFTIWALLMLVAVIVVNFHYVRIESNEVIVVGGVLDKRRRYSTMRLTYTKEIHDVFEYYLPFVRSGSLIMRFPNEEQPLILENVMQIDKVIQQLEMLTSVMQVSPGEHTHD